MGQFSISQRPRPLRHHSIPTLYTYACSHFGYTWVCVHSLKSAHQEIHTRNENRKAREKEGTVCRLYQEILDLNEMKYKLPLPVCEHQRAPIILAVYIFFAHPQIIGEFRPCLCYRVKPRCAVYIERRDIVRKQIDTERK